MGCTSSNDEIIVRTSDDVSIENAFFRITFSEKTGTFAAYDKITDEVVWEGAELQFDNFSTSNDGIEFSFRENALEKEGVQGKALTVEGKSPDGKEIALTIEIYEQSSGIIFTPSIINHTGKPFRIKNIFPLANAVLYPRQDFDKIQVLDGNGGAEVTHVRNEPFAYSRNNLLITTKSGNDRRSISMGGISYEFFEKFASVDGAIKRSESLTHKMEDKKLKLKSYLNLGREKESGGGEAKLNLEQGENFTFQTVNIPEVNQIAFHKSKLTIRSHNLDPDKKYTLGFSWIDEWDERIQNVWVADAQNPEQRFPILLHHALPVSVNADPATWHLKNIPLEAYKSGDMNIYFEKDKEAPNVVVSEVWISQGNISPDGAWGKVEGDFSGERLINMYAKDPVGKLVEDGDSFRSERDKFYMDFITTDPFESLEKYAFVLKEEQDINLRHYTFPTVCLWYASHGGYGGEVMAVNDSRGAVQEMMRIKNSGFLNYSTAAVRLVPDSYLENNEQGWWDDKHWQMYGSGSGNENVEYNVKVEGAHYKPPYETTKKWSDAVANLGGIPLLYFQTSVRSQDYADKFPGQMLFNESNHEVSNIWPNPNKAGYDFTDPDFIAHMEEVYANLKKAGIEGLMYDYPVTGWSEEGGFENKEVTTAWAYRNIFKLAYENLWKDSTLLHERNLARGSDVTLGLIASQRVWGDTDGMTPEMLTRCGLRWYKNRVVLSYDTDSKNLIKFREISRDKLRQVLTMTYVATGRLLMGNSFGLMTKEDIYDLSRVFPYPQTNQSARPVDAFINYYPTIYDFKVNDAWHQLTLYNNQNEQKKNFNISLSNKNVEGGLSLAKDKSYYLFDFWNQHFIGKLSGNSLLDQTLRPAEARMISIHEVKDYPQFISTNRHLMQGYIDLDEVKWNGEQNKLSGTANVTENEAFKIIVASNEFLPLSIKADNQGSFIDIDPLSQDGLYEIIIENPRSAPVQWEVKFKKKSF